MRSIPTRCDVRCALVTALLPDDPAFASAFAALPAWRRRKAEAFRFDADRRRSVAAWLLLRQLLSERGVDADALPVAENDCGKPYFDPPVGLHFSLSHAGDRVMAAVSDAEVGCDVERIVPIDDGMMNVCLSIAERQDLTKLSGPARDRMFFRLWVRKESYVKAIGRGMSIDLTTVSAADEPPPGWTWQDFAFEDGYLGSLCCRQAES